MFSYNLVYRNAKAWTMAFGVLVAPALVPGQSTGTITEARPDQPITRYTFRNVAKKVSPAVVNIKIKSNIQFGQPGTSGQIRIPQSFGFDDQTRDYLERLFEREMPSWTPNDRDSYKYARSASGVVVRKEGYVVTSNHVVSDSRAEDIEISLPDGRSLSNIKIVGLDELTDLAVLKIENPPADLVSLNWGDSDSLEVGDHVVAIGNPLEFNNSVSEGIVSAKHRTIRKAAIEDLIQTTAMINPGNSGGALVDLDGDLIGINMAIATSTGLWSGLGFAIPSKVASSVTDQIIDRGKVARGYLGILMYKLTGSLAHQMGYEQDFGIMVEDVTAGSAAEKAGLQRYDIIAKVDGKEIQDDRDMHRSIGMHATGDTVELEVYRDEGSEELTQKKISVLLDERPDQTEIQSMIRGRNATAPPPPSDKSEEGLLGLKVEPSTDGKGLVVKSVDKDSRSAQAGIKPGDVLLKVNRKPVSSAEELKVQLESTNQGTEPRINMFFLMRGESTVLMEVRAE